MRVALGVAALGGLLVWEALDGWTRERVRVLAERLPDLLLEMTVSMAAWQSAVTKLTGAMQSTSEELAAHLLDRYRSSPAPEFYFVDEVSPRSYTVTRPDRPPQVIDASQIDWSTTIAFEFGFGEYTQGPDDSWIDSHSSRGEELERLERVIEEHRQGILRTRPDRSDPS